jgi:hypothetical protein
MLMSPSSALALQDQARRGDAGAVRDFVLLSAWRRIQEAKSIPRKKKPRAFIALANAVNIEVETNGR